MGPRWSEDMNIYRAADLLNVQERNIIDLISPANPLGPSKKVKAEIRKNLKYLGNEADPESMRARGYLARHLGCKVENIICSADHAGLLAGLMMELQPARTVVPATDSHMFERAFRHYQDTKGEGEGEDGGKSIVPFDLPGAPDLPVEKLIACLDGADMVLLSNPNRITGGMIEEHDIMELAREAGKRGCYLVVDESFIDFGPGGSLADKVDDEGFLVVLRSMGPYHALSGLGFSCGVMGRRIIDKMKVHGHVRPPDLLSQRAVPVAVKDRGYRKETAEWLNEEKALFEKEMIKLGIEYIPSRTHCYLLSTGMSERICDELLSKGIMIGRFDDIDGPGERYVFVALKDRRSNAELIKELKRLMPG